jgi:hypothetical protein
MLCRSLVHTILHHFPEFDKKYNVEDFWWMPSVSWLNKKTIKWTIKYFGYRLQFYIPTQVSDAFHWFNTVELGCYDAIITILICLWLGLAWWIGVIIFLVIGVILMPLFFNLGYNELWV